MTISAFEIQQREPETQKKSYDESPQKKNCLRFKPVACKELDILHNILAIK